MQTEQEVVAYIGLDWGDQQHRVEVQAAAGGPVDRYELEQRPEALHAWVAQLAPVFAQHPDHELFASFPGTGPVCAPRLAAAFGTDRARWEAATELQVHSSIAPVTERSGKAVWVHHRLACPKFVKQTFHEGGIHLRKQGLQSVPRHRRLQ